MDMSATMAVGVVTNMTGEIVDGAPDICLEGILDLLAVQGDLHQCHARVQRMARSIGTRVYVCILNVQLATGIAKLAVIH